MASNEQDIRVEILNTLLTTPHRKLDEVWPVHRSLAERDPRFYVRLAAWYHDHGDVRDHKEMFLVTLILSAFEGHRDVGLALLRGLPLTRWFGSWISSTAARRCARSAPRPGRRVQRQGRRAAAARPPPQAR